MCTRGQKEEITTVVKESFRNLLENETLINSIVEKVSASIKLIIEKQSKAIQKLEADIQKVAKNNEVLTKRLNIVEKCMVKSTVRIHGIEENENENINPVIMNLFNNVMKLNISENSISDVYRIGKIERPAKKSGKQKQPECKQPTKSGTKNEARVIIVKFTNIKGRQEVIYNRKRLKSTGIKIYEELSTSTLNLFKEGMKKFAKGDIWTYGDNVYVKVDGIRRRLREEDVYP